MPLPAPQDHRDFGHNVDDPERLHNVQKFIVADTGCQSTSIPPRFAYEAGFKKKDFIPVVSRMNGAGRSDLAVQGAVVMEFTISGPGSETYSTKQLCYVCDRVDQVYMSRQSLIDLQCISPQFPLPGATVAAVECNGENTSKCDCPPRSSQPPPCLPRCPLVLSTTVSS